MKLPNKINSYKESILYAFPIILSAINGEDSKPIDLYEKISKKIEFVVFIEALDCLYYLSQIEIDAKGNIRYVGHGSK